MPWSPVAPRTLLLALLIAPIPTRAQDAPVEPPAEPVPTTEPVSPAEPVPADSPVPDGLPYTEPAYGELIRGKRSALTNRHGARYTTGQHLVWTGIAETAVGIGALNALRSPSNGGNEGLRLAASAFVGIGTGSVLAGSLVAQDALHDDGFRATAAPGWTGVGLWGIGMTAYGVDILLVNGEPRPLGVGIGFLASGTALGLVQAAVNSGERRRQLRNASLLVTPLADAEHQGLLLSGSF